MIKFYAEGSREGPILGAPGALHAKPEELMDELKAGRLRSIQFQAQVFVTGPNRNHFVLPDTELEAFAKSFEGLPFLRDHDEQLSSVGGRIVSSELATLEDGRKAIKQRIMATKPWAMENLLDGTIQKFSIGWFAKSQVCTACESSFSTCKHHPHELGTVDEKTKKTIEVRTEGNEGREVSAVVTPAVSGTGIEALMQAKEEWIQKNGTTSGTGQPDVTSGTESGELSGEAGMNLSAILAALGVAETATEPEVLDAIGRAKAPVYRIPVPLLTALGCKAEATEDEAVAAAVLMTAPDAFVARSEHDKVAKELSELKSATRVDELISSGRIAPANKEWALRTAISNPAGFESMFGKDKNPPRVTALSVQPPPILNEEVEVKEGELSEIAKKLGVDPKIYAQVVAEEKGRA